MSVSLRQQQDDEHSVASCQDPSHCPIHQHATENYKLVMPAENTRPLMGLVLPEAAKDDPSIPIPTAESSSTSISEYTRENSTNEE